MSEIFTNLGIDWKLLLAQVVNFGILVWVLKRFVYTPIIGVLEKRRKDVADVASAKELAETKIRELDIEKEKVLKTARMEATAIINKAETTAKKQGEEILNQAKKKSDDFMKEAKENLEREQSKMKAELKNELGEIVALAVEKTVGDVINKEAEEKLKKEALAIININATH